MRAVLTIPIKAAIGNHQILSVVAVWIRPGSSISKVSLKLNTVIQRLVMIDSQVVIIVVKKAY